MTSASFSTARNHMINGQILTGNVLSGSVIHALASVTREQFVPSAFQGVAYVDEAIPLATDRTLMEPLVFARILETASLTRTDSVLIIGAGYGYSAAVASHLAANVVAIEEDATLFATAKPLLAAYQNVVLCHAPLVEGKTSGAPYDVIIIEGAIEQLPHTITDQLKEQGRLLTVEHISAKGLTGAGLGKLVEYKKLNNTLHKTILHDANVPLLTAFKKPNVFVF